jgi:hypothetical protein
MDDWNIARYTITFLGANHVNELKTIWTNKIPLKNEVNTNILDFMIKKKKNILGKERQELMEFIKKKYKKATDKEIEDVFEGIDSTVKAGHSLILGCQKCKKGVLSFKKWFNEPYAHNKKNTIFMNEEMVLDKALKVDKIICPWCSNNINSIYTTLYKVYEVKRNYSVNHYYTYSKK